VIEIAEGPVLDRHAAIAAAVLDVETLVAAVVGAKFALAVAMTALVLDEPLSAVAALYALRLVAAVTASILDDPLVAPAALGALRFLAAMAALRLEVGKARLIAAAPFHSLRLSVAAAALLLHSEIPSTTVTAAALIGE
jgi:hypothetical protein